MNRKCFILIELLATIIILALVVSISSYAIASLIKNAKNKNYNLLIKNIKDAGELYYQECRYGDEASLGVDCTTQTDGSYHVALGTLVKYGYLKGNETDNNNKYIIVNPLDNTDISTCMVAIAYQNGTVEVTSLTNTGSCPSAEINDGNGLTPYHEVTIIPINPGIPLDPVRPPLEDR